MEITYPVSVEASPVGRASKILVPIFLSVFFFFSVRKNYIKQMNI